MWNGKWGPRQVSGSQERPSHRAAGLLPAHCHGHGWGSACPSRSSPLVFPTRRFPLRGRVSCHYLPVLTRQARWDRQALLSPSRPALNAAGRSPQRDSDRGAGLSQRSHLQPLRSPPLHRGNRGSVRLGKKFVTMLRTRPRPHSPSRTCWLPADSEEGLIVRGPTPGVSAPSRVPARRSGTWKPHVRGGGRVALRA